MYPINRVVSYTLMAQIRHDARYQSFNVGDGLVLCYLKKRFLGFGEVRMRETLERGPGPHSLRDS